jgi:protein phosphatase
MDLDRHIFVIADGMGGHLAGDEASREAVESAIELLCRAKDPKDAIGEAILAAQAAVSSHGDNRGTTLTVAVIDGDRLHVGHVGDTRIYLGERQITRDQGVGYVLEEFVGGDYPPRLQRHTLELPDDAWLLLSTDGIHDVLPVEGLFDPLTETCDGDPELIARMLALAAVEGGSTDNCTAIVVHVQESG